MGNVEFGRSTRRRPPTSATASVVDRWRQRTQVYDAAQPAGQGEPGSEEAPCDGCKESLAFGDIGLDGFVAGPLWQPAIVLT